MEKVKASSLTKKQFKKGHWEKFQESKAAGHVVVILNDTITKRDTMRRVNVEVKVPYTVSASYPVWDVIAKSTQEEQTIWNEIGYIVVDMEA